MPKFHILHDYGEDGDEGLGNTALHVGTCMDGNINFTDPPIKPADLKTAANTFIIATAVCKDGTTADTLHKITLRVALSAMLDKLAAYVELESNNDPEIIKSSGFKLASTTAAKPAPVGTVTITSVTNTGTGCLTLGLAIGPNVWGVEVQVSSEPNVWVAAGYFTDPRDVTPVNLKPGTLYGIRACVHGSINQVSDWSDTVTHMAT